MISNFLKQAPLGENLTVDGDGTQTRSFCYVSDEIEGILRLSRSEEHYPVNIGNPHEFTILECAREVLKATGSNSKTGSRQFDLETGLKLSIAYFQECLALECAESPRKD